MVLDDNVVELVKMIALAGAIYGGIRQDIKAICERITRIEIATDQAHHRIDDVLKGK